MGQASSGEGLWFWKLVFDCDNPGVGKLEDLLELLRVLHDGEQPYATLRARYREWVPAEPARRPRDQESGESPNPFDSSRTPERERRDSVVSLWRAWPDKVRIERSGGARDREYQVTQGELWWRWDPRSGIAGNVEDRGPIDDRGDEYGLLFSPRRLLALFRFEPIGRGVRAGRPVIITDARQASDLAPFGQRDRFALTDRLPIGLYGDTYRLEIDAERGIVLAWSTHGADEVRPQLEALDLELDEPVPDRTFAFEPPPGAPAQGPGFPLSLRAMSPAEAQAITPFTVLVPRKIPNGWELECDYIDDGPEVYLHYYAPLNGESVTLAEKSSRAESPFDHADGWEPAQIGGHRAYVRGGDERLTESQLVIERDRTHVFMNGRQLDRKALIVFARLLTPAPSAS